MRIDKKMDEGILIITPYGRIDSGNVDEFFDALEDVDPTLEKIVLDFGEVEYISSSGLRALLGLRKNCPEANIRIEGVSDTVFEVFEMTGFDSMFEIDNFSLEHLDVKALFLDIDGTLLSHKTGQIPQSAVSALKKAQEKGIAVVISTGRDLVELEKLPIKEIDYDGYLTLNGNICLDKEKKMFAGNAIDPGELEILVGIFKAGHIPFVLIGKEKRYINYVDDTVIHTQMETHGTIPDIGEYKGEEIFQCIAFADDSVRSKLEELLDQCRITSWNETGLDIIAKTGGKDAGVRKYLEAHGLKRSQAMAFGDGENDLAMIRYAGVGVAMGNGSQSLKQRADYVTDTVDDDGIEKALLHFGLIE